MDITPYIGEIRLFAGKKAPVDGWVLCDGSSLPISDYMDLYTRIGETFGGDGMNFNVPNLKNRVPVNVGQKDNTVKLKFGVSDGSVRKVVTMDNFPPHTHQVLAIEGDAGTDDPKDASLAITGTLNFFAAPLADGTDKVAMHADAITTEGVDYSVSVMQYYQTINYIIATKGI